jgi:hypothetical protein
VAECDNIHLVNSRNLPSSVDLREVEVDFVASSTGISRLKNEVVLFVLEPTLRLLQRSVLQLITQRPLERCAEANIE